MTDIYDLHRKAFDRVSAYVITERSGGPGYGTGDKVAVITIKFPADGAGRLWAYVHWLGSPMVRASAGGYGYDKATAAISAAASAIELADWSEHRGDAALQRAHTFKETLAKADSGTWQHDLGKAGFNVLQAV